MDRRYIFLILGSAFGPGIGNQLFLFQLDRDIYSAGGRFVLLYALQWKVSKMFKTR